MAEEKDPNGSLQGEEGNNQLSSTVIELKLNFELQLFQMKSRLLAITEYQRDMFKMINGNFENYKSERESRY